MPSRSSPFAVPRRKMSAIRATKGECISLTLRDRRKWRARCWFSSLSKARNSRIVDVVLPGECQQSNDRFFGAELLEVEHPFGGANVLIGPFEHGEIERFLLAHVIIKHALVSAGRLGDPVDARAAIAVARKFVGRRAQDTLAHSLPGRAASRMAAWWSFSIGGSYWVQVAPFWPCSSSRSHIGDRWAGWPALVMADPYRFLACLRS